MWPFASTPEPGPPPEPTPSCKLAVKNRSEAPLRCMIELWGRELVLPPEGEVEILAFGTDGSAPSINVVHDQDRLTLYLEFAERFELRYPNRS